jgi:hypothetical protein
MTDFRCSVHGQFNSELTWSFATCLSSGSGIDTVLANWHNAWVVGWTDATNGLAQFYPTSTEMLYTRVAQLDGTMHETQNRINEETHAGIATGDTLPYLNSIVVRQTSGFTKRYNRGRFYLPAMEETFVNGNILISSAQNKISLAVKGVFTSITAGGDQVFVTSRKPHKDGTGQYQKTVITNWTVSNKPARMSRRTKKQVPIYV